MIFWIIIQKVSSIFRNRAISLLYLIIPTLGVTALLSEHNIRLLLRCASVTLCISADLFLSDKIERGTIRHPSRHISSVTFNNDNTPVSFSNFITYRIGDNGEVKHIENKFYVSQITNISDKKELVKSKEKDCNGLVSKQMYMKDYSSSSFYISYPFSKYRGMKY